MSDLKIFAKTVEKSAHDQIDLLLKQPAFADCKVRIMPDVHAGAGCVIGFTANLGDKVIPNVVGVDIGCGMFTVSLASRNIDYSKLDTTIRALVPSGMAVHRTPEHCDLIDGLRCGKQLRNAERLHSSMGTLGGGNHFIEVDTDESGGKYLIIHTGSRNLGKQVAEIYQDMAIKSCQSVKQEREAVITNLKAQGREQDIAGALAEIKAKTTIPRDLCYLEGQNRADYLHDMRICQQYAERNRERIADTIARNMGWSFLLSFHTVHNYIDDTGMVRKGAVSAKAGQLLLIPINMRDGCIVGRGKGNPDWNESAPHGAGRIMSRSKARALLTVEEYRAAMDGIFTTSVDDSTVDEAPQAYKPIAEILAYITDTVEIVDIIKPVYNFKAGDNT